MPPQIDKTPSANRLHIALFGKRNAGKSLLFNALISQDVAIVSDVKGTTTDPVSKTLEIAPLGPVVIIDTAGIDDDNMELGALRVQKTIDTLRKTDIALLVLGEDFSNEEEKLIELFKEYHCPFIVVFNKIDIFSYKRETINQLWEKQIPTVSLSAKTKEHLDILINKIITHSPQQFESPTLLGDLINPCDLVELVIPIDKGMPRGRLILPQIQTMRDILDHQGTIHISKETELESALKQLKIPPKLVVTDSQIFEFVDKIVPQEIMLTSFSILMARFKGDLQTLVDGAKALMSLQKGDKVLIAEACTHVQQDQDIATIKIPLWVHKKIDPSIQFDFTNGTQFPKNLSQYALIIHCGGCMINRKEMLYRLSLLKDQHIPVTNYGVAIAAMHGILERALKPFKDLLYNNL
jgi:[FeFe] hydrogenase H-cluster maturation GTPase HydF